ncbi:hypothetical protein DPM19_30210 [Actinomadura craniellae]|uniref:histidine kinase n=1 Tax=Actinomadura craniellae TaxID=2231787 RepID=A0A365GXK7_9ACTN|nr:ATP-binding protein [Actinomadura craniellae]RAY11574.1 hypothetical protein DPM19_30210 [Actinomadura craniellae]
MRGDTSTDDLARQRRFTADAAHELSTPLAGLRVELEEARLHPEETDLHRLIDSAIRDVNRLEAIVTDLLLLARVTGCAAMQCRPIDLADTVRSHVIPRPGDPDIRLRTVPEVMVNAVPAHLGRAVTCLLDNARRHARRLVQVQVSRYDCTAELTVTDDGPGIPVQERERIFERFARLDTARDRHQGGTGLGLTIARDIAHAYSGTLHVEEASGGGARFVFRLPLHRVA